MKHKESIELGTVLRSAALLALLGAAGISSAEGMRSYRSLAISGNGERIAALEAVEGEPKTGPRVVVRDTATGKVVSTFVQSDCAQCRIEAPVWSPDGSAMALVSTDSKAGTATIHVLRDGQLKPV